MSELYKSYWQLNLVEQKRLKVLRAIDKLDRLGPWAVLQLLTVGRKDESGDFTSGAGLSLEAASFIIMLTIGIKIEVSCYRPETGHASVII